MKRYGNLGYLMIENDTFKNIQEFTKNNYLLSKFFSVEEMKNGYH